MSGSTSTQNPVAQNRAIRDLIFASAKPIFQRVTNGTLSNLTSGNATVRINPLQIGFLRRFVVEVTATISNGGTSSVSLTPNGVDNILSNVQFSDFSNNPRINCSGRALAFVEAAKYGRIPGAALTSDAVDGFGSVVASNSAPATIAANGTATISRVFEIPVMVDTGRFMAGGLWLGVANQSTQLSLTFNANPIVATGGDPLPAIYTGGTALPSTPQVTSLNYTVYQDYWSFGPSLLDKAGNPILPPLDISTAYMVVETNSGMTFAAGQKSAWNFPTFSKLLGTYLTFDNGNQLNPGTDVTEISLVLSNYSIVKQFSPKTLDRLTRDVCRASFPAGTYPIMSRLHPLDVVQYPSLQLLFEPSTVNAGAYALITTELLRPVQFLTASTGMGGV